MIKFSITKAFCLFIFLQFLLSCNVDRSAETKLFRLVKSSESGITFRNNIKESLEFNIFNYMYFYNGAGVAVGDVNGDGLLDIYFTANQNQNKLYLNKGNFKFEDITIEAGVEGFNGWATGVTMADVNADGLIDIYVSYLGDHLIFKGKNQLFINDGNTPSGIPKFKDRAIEYGLDLVGFSTQAAFFDYDKDGDLDMFMLNHSVHENGTFGTAKRLRYQSHPLAGDKLMRNDNNRFIDVTSQSGILDNVIGYGLGVVVSDVNLDGWPDIYVGNDFHENDYLYLNQRDGKFKECLESSMNHTSRYTMGVDFADFNNDGFPDLISSDMLPEDPFILKASAAEDAYDLVDFKITYGYNYQYSRNTLQLNQHNGTFSEIGRFSGVHATDWSWSALFADFDLDGFKDIIISNGILRRSNDLDYINFITDDSIQMKMKFDMTEKEVGLISKMPKIKVPNYIYRNNHDSTFTNKAKEWGLDEISYSNGTAYADLDNDGDLDLVINNIEDEAFLYENQAVAGESKRSNYLSFALKGDPGNAFGIGAKVILYQGKSLQIQECMPTRGYESSVDYRLVFGTGNANSIDSVLVVWPDDSFQKLLNVQVNQKLELSQANASGSFNYLRFFTQGTIFSKPENISGLTYRHEENKFIEFNREALMPHMVSTEGPKAAVADVNGDGLDDIFVCGAKWQAACLYVQQKNGNFIKSIQKVFSKDSIEEDVDAIFFDADGDLSKDLLVISGGNEFSDTSRYLLPRLYLNKNGQFSRLKGFPNIYLNGSDASASDIDKDGDLDLFIGARSIPWNYGLEPDSYILFNDGKGNFTDVTSKAAPFLKKFGFVKDSRWLDIDQDNDEDLVIATEWMPIMILINDSGILRAMPLAESGLESSNGWWNTVEGADFDGDGDIDLVAGNMGLNSKLRASKEQPIKMYVSDFDANGSIEQVLTHVVNGVEYPFNTRDEMTKQMPYLKKKYLSYSKFAKATFSDMFTKEQISKANVFNAFTFESSYIENLGNGKFKVTPFDKPVQFSTVNSFFLNDLNHDGKTDVLLAGNFYPLNIQMGRYDASYGLVLINNGKGRFRSLAPFESGFSVNGEVRQLAPAVIQGRPRVLALRNNSTIQVFNLPTN